MSYCFRVESNAFLCICITHGFKEVTGASFTVSVLHEDRVDEPHQRVVSRIRECAEARGLALNLLAYRAGTSRVHLFDVLAGRKSPTLKYLGKVAAVLGVDVADLLATDARRGPA